MNYQQWLQYATDTLRCGSSTPRCDAEVLLSHSISHTRAYIWAFGETMLSVQQLQELNQLLSKRQSGEPIAYLIGYREFWSLPLQLSAATLIPRPESECLVEQCLAHLSRRSSDIVDLGCGCGALALAIASERPDCRVTAVEYSARALAVAQQNARCLGVTTVAFKLGDWFSPLMGSRFDIVLSNPPYLSADDPHLQQGDLRFEPWSALVSAQDGLADLRSIVQHAWSYLRPGGWLLLEHGWQQGEHVAQMLRRAGYTGVCTITDYNGWPRVSLGQRPFAMRLY